LRRRFAFADLEPRFGKVWRDWVASHNGVDVAHLREIEKRMVELNSEIASDAGLGSQFRVGHSYVTPSRSTKIKDAYGWFRQVVETEIGPLLKEYWFDSEEKAQKATERLVEGL
jgi:5-methylcytosine-specific restriction protein B